MECCICHQEIEVKVGGWNQGNNAEPVVINGRCCDECNWNVVIPARIYDIKRSESES